MVKVLGELFGNLSYPKPSFAPLSADMIYLTFLGTCFSAYLPFTIAFARIGSVGVTAAEIQSASRKVSPGMNNRMNPAEMNHAKVTREAIRCQTE